MVRVDMSRGFGWGRVIVGVTLMGRGMFEFQVGVTRTVSSSVRFSTNVGVRGGLHIGIRLALLSGL